MRLPARFAFAPFALLALTAPPVEASPTPLTPATVSEVASFHYAGPVAAARTVRLNAFDGGITVSQSADGKLDVRAVAVDGDASRVRVISREEAGGVAICVLFADETPDDCRLNGVDRASSGNRHENGPTIDLVARVPAGVSLIAGTLNGAIHARGLSGDVHASTLNGDVEVSRGNVAEATTLNGNVTATFGRAPPATARVALTTNNGNVKVSLPVGVDADIDASTIHGEITTSFPMAIETTPGGFGPKSGRARLGNGGARIRAESINGNVDVRSGG
jgi:hypothetical protein